jgi:hypothetical protein
VTDDVDFLRFVLPKRLGDFRADHQAGQVVGDLFGRQTVEQDQAAR